MCVVYVWCACGLSGVCCVMYVWFVCLCVTPILNKALKRVNQVVKFISHKSNAATNRNQYWESRLEKRFCGCILAINKL